jgi:ribonuclease P protein component
MSFYSFPKKFRLIHKLDYQKTFQRAKKINSRYFRLYFYKTGTDPQLSRLGLAISKKNIRHAIHRNRIKRIVRESFRYNQERLKGYDVVVLANRDANAMDKPTLRQEMDKLWKKII